MPLKEYLNPDGSGFVHLVGTPYVCPPGTTPEQDGGVCVGEPTGRFEPPTEEQIAVLMAANQQSEAFLAPPGFIPPPTLAPFPVPEVAPAPAVKPSPSILGGLVGVATRIGGLIGGLLYPSDSADSDLGIKAPPGGFSAEPTPDFRGYVDLNPENSNVDVRSRPIYGTAPLPSAFVTPPAFPLFDAPGLPFQPFAEPFSEPELDPAPASPPLRPPRVTPLIDEPFQFDPDEGDFRVDRYPPIPAPLIPFNPGIFVDPNLYTVPAPTNEPTPLPTPTPTPGFTPNPFDNPLGTPFENPLAQPLPVPVPAPLPRPPQTPSTRTPGPGTVPIWTPTGASFLDPQSFAAPSPARPKDCPPCVEQSAPTKSRKKRQPREECWRGTYTETSKGLIKNRREKVPCR